MFTIAEKAKSFMDLRASIRDEELEIKSWACKQYEILRDGYLSTLTPAEIQDLQKNWWKIPDPAKWLMYKGSLSFTIDTKKMEETPDTICIKFSSKDHEGCYVHLKDFSIDPKVFDEGKHQEMVDDFLEELNSWKQNKEDEKRLAKTEKLKRMKEEIERLEKETKFQ